MGVKKKSKKKSVKNTNLDHERAYFVNVIKLLDYCAEQNQSNDLGAYFKSKADLNRERLKNLK